jgi:nicotinamidase-related amidase
MLKKMCFIMVFFILAFPLLAQSFDCNKPDFGARIEELNKDGYFVKYMEKAGISYYNYTGPCRMEVHDRVNPLISFAFIENQLYARLIKILEENADPSDARKRLEERVLKQIGDSKLEKKQDGDWWIYQWFNEKEKLKFKVKIHNKTNERKTAFYYEPLRAKLKLINDDDDPVSLRH